MPDFAGELPETTHKRTGRTGKGYAITAGMATTIRANTFLQRLIGAAALDAAIYEEVESDVGAMGQAMSVVVLSSIAIGIGARGLGGGAGTVALFGVIALVTWAAWALLMFEVGARLLPGRRTRSNPYELLRTLGFAATPGFAAVLASVPGVTDPGAGRDLGVDACRDGGRRAPGARLRIDGTRRGRVPRRLGAGTGVCARSRSDFRADGFVNSRCRVRWD